MDRETAGAADAEPPRPAARRSRRIRAAIGALAVLAVIAVTAVVTVSLSAAGSKADARAATPRPSPSASASPTVAAIYKKIRPSVVLVQTASDLGSGVIVADDGSVLTANHVIAGANGPITVTYADGTMTQATVASANAKLDIAVLTPAQLPQVVVPANLGGSPGVGAPVVAVGNPLGLDDSVSSGVVSGLNRTAQTAQGTFGGLIQFDASVNPGSSGGPLLNQQGLVVGIVVSIANPANQDAFAGIGFAVPIGSALGGGNNGAGPHGPPL